MGRPKTSSKKTWQKTNVQGLLRHTKSGRYYARLFIAGKEKWLSLKTTSFEVAKGRMRSNEMIADVRRVQDSAKELSSGRVSVGTLIELYRAEIGTGVRTKDSTKNFWRAILNSLLTSWPELAERDIRGVTHDDCARWLAAFTKSHSATYSNNAALALRRIFEIGLTKGAIFRNPAQKLERVRVKPPPLSLPTREQFRKIVTRMRNTQYRTANDAADLIELLAFTGCRIGEARRITWENVDFDKGVILVKGDPITGTKNWDHRTIPMLPECRRLLLDIQKRHSGQSKTAPILKIGEARVSLAKAAKEEGAPPITHHDLRHFFATVAIESGVDVPTVSRWLGHKDGGALAMKVYAHSNDQHSQAAAKKVRFS